MNLDLDSIYRNFFKLFNHLTSRDRIQFNFTRQFLNIIQNLYKAHCPNI